MTRAGGFGVGGVGSLTQTTETEILWGSDLGRLIVIRKSAVIDGATRDAGNTPTTVLRPGLILGKVTATGKYKEYDPDGSDGTQIAEAILPIELKATDFDANDADRHFGVIVGGLVRAGKLLLLDDQARTQMGTNGRFLFDDDLINKQSFLGVPWTNEQAIADTTLVAADTGKRFVATTADVDFTLPAIANGLAFKFLRASEHEMAIISAEGDNLIVGNDLAADSLTFTTAGDQIGVQVFAEALYVGTTLKWLVTYDIPPLGTGVTAGVILGIAT